MGKKHKKKLAGVSLYVIAVFSLCLFAAVGSMVLVLGPKLVGFNDISRKSLSEATVNADPELIAEAKESVGDDVLNAMDCSNYPPAERKPGENCIVGLLASSTQSKSPVPDRAAFMLPIWKSAAARYGLPWEVLAAAEGARSNFGWINCESEDGLGVYRLDRKALRKYGVDAGSMRVKTDGAHCFQAVPPDAAPQAPKGKKKASRERHKLRFPKPSPLETLKGDSSSRTASPYDPVDATFTYAKQLAANGAFKQKEWDYTGSGTGQCTVSASDGRVWYLPYMDLGYGPGARIGFNKRLDIPKKMALLAAKYRSNKGKYKPRRDPDRNRHPMKKKHLISMLKAVWFAFGARGEELERNVTLNYAQIGLESGGRPYILQGYIGDVNDNNPAGGLFQFIEGTFDFWKVDGFNDRFNPLDNMLAAVNAQVNGPYKILDGTSGWSPPTSNNPYSTGGKSRLVGDKETSGAVPKKPYTGKPQIDKLSKAVRYQGPGRTSSDCYVAVVWEWYKQIKKNPPEPGMTLNGPLRDRIVKIAESERRKNVTETGGDNVPRYRPQNVVAPYNIYAAWCQAFAARIWYWAGIKEMTKLGGMKGADGLTMPSHVNTMTAWGHTNNRYKTKNPKPGDMAIYGSRHVEIVEKVKNGKVLSTIGGNTGDAVIRVTAPSGITHFISPPDKAGKSNYALASPDQMKDIDSLEKRLGVEIGVISTSGGDTVNVGSFQSSKAYGTVGLPVAVTYLKQNPAKTLSRQQKQMVDAALKGRLKLYDALKNPRKDVTGTLRKAGDNMTALEPSLGATIWRAEDANNFMLKLANGKLLDKKNTKYLMDRIARLSVSWGIPNSGFSAVTGISRSKQLTVRQTGTVKGKAVTVILKTRKGNPGKLMNRVSKWVRKNTD